MADAKKPTWQERWPALYEQMRNRMEVSGHKYGAIADNYPHRQDAIKTLIDRLDKYLETHNTEWLLDVANMALIEATCPRFEDATFRATDSNESPGLVSRRGANYHGKSALSAVARLRAELGDGEAE